MTDEQKGGLAFITGTATLIVVMALHPSGHQMTDAGGFSGVVLLGTVIHTVGLLVLPFLFFGAVALTRSLAGRSTAVAALVLYGFALAAGLCAAAASGYVARDVLRQLARAATPEAEQTWRVLFRYTGIINQAFARILVVAAAAAILSWSLALERPTALRWYGVGSSLAIIAAVASGALTLDVHGYGAVVVAQGIWFVAVGAMMMRRRVASGAAG